MTHDTILDELDEYCSQTGLKRSTVCLRALNDGKYITRYYRRLEVLTRDAEKIRQYMKDNPPAVPDRKGAA